MEKKKEKVEQLGLGDTATLRRVETVKEHGSKRASATGTRRMRPDVHPPECPRSQSSPACPLATTERDVDAIKNATDATQDGCSSSRSLWPRSSSSLWSSS